MGAQGASCTDQRNRDLAVAACPQYHPPRQRNSMPPRVAQGTEECEGFDASTRSQMRLGDRLRVPVVCVENGQAAPPTSYLLLDRLFFARTPHLASTITESQQQLVHACPQCRAAAGPSLSRYALH